MTGVPELNLTFWPRPEMAIRLWQIYNISNYWEIMFLVLSSWIFRRVGPRGGAIFKVLTMAAKALKTLAINIGKGLTKEIKTVFFTYH